MTEAITYYNHGGSGSQRRGGGSQIRGAGAEIRHNLTPDYKVHRPKCLCANNRRIVAM